VFAVLGNHDGWFDHDRVERALVKYHVRVVEDTAVRIGDGSSAWWLPASAIYGRAVTTSLRRWGATKDDGSPIVLMTHNPMCSLLCRRGSPITLAGHTHGGQCWLPLIGRPNRAVGVRSAIRRRHIVEGGRHLYVATGVGTSIIPVRLGVRPSVPVIRIVPLPRH
jgi:predicted MPP superfamily phosphohydrolase